MAQATEDEGSTDLSKIGSFTHYIYFRNDTHENSLLKEMKKLYDDDQLKDVTLCAGGLEFSCHKNVLAATSPYFKLMFTLEMAESKKDRIDIYDVNEISLREIIEYAYTGRVKITRSNAQNLLAAASLFQILPVQRACAKFMETQLDIHNCIGIHFFAEYHNCVALKIKAREFIEKNFTEVCTTDEFMALTFTKLMELILSDELNVDKEEVVMDAVFNWINHDRLGRKGFLCELLPLVRLNLVSTRYMEEKIRRNELIRKCVKCQEHLKDLDQYETNPGLYKGDTDFALSLRSGMYRPECCMLFIGGVEQTTIRPCINCYNPVLQECFYIEDFPEARKPDTYDCEDIACVVTEDNEIYAGGGNYIYHHLFEDSEDDSFEDLEYKEYVVQKDFYYYDSDHNEWILKSPMLFPKSNFTLASLKGKIYCFGGLTENKHPTEIIEVYDISRNRWNYQGMLPTTLVDLGSVVYDDSIYLLGGRTGVGAHNSLISGQVHFDPGRVENPLLLVQGQVEKTRISTPLHTLLFRYNPESEEWTSLAGMLTPRFNFGSCVVQGEIYVAGGQIYSHSTFTITREVLRTMEIYNIDTNQWRLGPEIPLGLYNVHLSLINGVMYACGTPDYQDDQPNQRYNVVCKLDLGTSQWEVIEDSLCNVRNFRCVVAKMHTRKLQKVFVEKG